MVEWSGLWSYLIQDGGNIMFVFRVGFLVLGISGFTSR